MFVSLDFYGNFNDFCKKLNFQEIILYINSTSVCVFILKILGLYFTYPMVNKAWTYYVYTISNAAIYVVLYVFLATCTEGEATFNEITEL